MEDNILIVPLIAGFAALLYAACIALNNYKKGSYTGKTEETAKVSAKEIFLHLSSEYKIIAMFITAASIVILLLIGIKTAAVFMVGALLSIIAGFFGILISNSSCSRTEYLFTGSQKSISDMLIKGGLASSMSAVGLGLIGTALVYIIFKDTSVMAAYIFGVISAALLLNIGNIRPSIRGMNSIIFEAYCSLIVSAVIAGSLAYKNGEGAAFALFAAAAGMVSSIAGSLFCLLGNNGQKGSAVKNGLYTASLLTLIADGILSYILFNGNIRPFYALALGIVAGMLSWQANEIYVSPEYKYAKRVSSESKNGGLYAVTESSYVGMHSAVMHVLFIAAVILSAFYLTGDTGSEDAAVNGFFGIALAALGILSTAGLSLSVDTTLPLSQNTFKAIEHMKPELVKEKQDAIFNLQKNFSFISSKVLLVLSGTLSAIVFLSAYAKILDLKPADLFSPIVITGVLAGGMMPYAFVPSIMDCKYKSMNQRIFTGMLIMTVPIITGLVFGLTTFAGLMTGTIIAVTLISMRMVASGESIQSAIWYDCSSKDNDCKVNYSLNTNAGLIVNMLAILFAAVSVLFGPLLLKYGGLIERLMK